MSESAHHILVVEDEPELRGYIVEELEDCGFAVSAAENGAVALTMARDDVPDLILTDIRMPKMTGTELFFAAREENALARVPFLFLTALSSTEALESLPATEKPHVIKKPVDYDFLISIIRARLEE